MKIVSNDGTRANVRVTVAEVQQIIYAYERWIKTLCEEKKQLEEDYKNELEENLKLSELWKKSQEEKRQLESNRDEAKKKLKEVREKRYMLLNEVEELLSILERGKE